MVSDALKRPSLTNVTSWDYMPGKSYETIIENPETINLLTQFINDLVQGQELPEKVALGRLFCLKRTILNQEQTKVSYH